MRPSGWDTSRALVYGNMRIMAWNVVSAENEGFKVDPKICNLSKISIPKLFPTCKYRRSKSKQFSWSWREISTDRQSVEISVSKQRRTGNPLKSLPSSPVWHRSSRFKLRAEGDLDGQTIRWNHQYWSSDGQAIRWNHYRARLSDIDQAETKDRQSVVISIETATNRQYVRRNHYHARLSDFVQE